MPLNLHLRPPVVIARISADVRHVDIHAFALPERVALQLSPQLRAIDIAPNSTCRLERLQLIQHLNRPKIPRMPNLIALREMFENSRVQVPVCVGKQTDAQ